MTFKLPETLEYKGVKFVLSEQDESRIQNAIDYLLPYGFGKSLQDSVAGVAKKMKDEGKSVAEISAAIAKDMAERAEAIFAGTIGLRGPRLTSEEAIRRDVVESFFRNWLVAKGKKLPTFKSKFGVTAKEATEAQKKELSEIIGKFRDAYATANAAKIDEEVARRVAMQSEEQEIDLDLDLEDDLTDDAGDESEGDEGDASDTVE